MKMDTTSNADIVNRCRLCLSAESEMHELFDEKFPELSKKIFDFTKIELRNIKGLPLYICENCKSKLVISWKFWNRCIKSDRILKSNFPHFFLDNSESDDAIEVEYLEFPESESELNLAEENLESTEEISPLSCEEDNSKNIVTYVVERRTNREKIENHGIIISDLKNVTKNGENHVLEKQLIVKNREKITPETLNTSIRTVNTPKNYYMRKCKICGALQENMEQHMLSHDEGKRHICPYCGHCFRYRGNLKHHINRHTGEKPYKCEYCDQAFPDPPSLRWHTVGHTGERRYRCEFCDKTYPYAQQLSIHRRIHTGEQLYLCKLCDKGFYRLSSLQVHVRIHTGEKPFTCEVCGKSFVGKSALRVHKITHTKEKRFKCQICQKRFGYRSVLNCHMKTHEREEEMNEFEEIQEK